MNGGDQRGYVRPGVGHTQCSIGAYEADAAPAACVGDCEADGYVTVDELLTLVNIALGAASMPTCGNGDANHDNAITVDEIVTAVTVALNGCGG